MAVGLLVTVSLSTVKNGAGTGCTAREACSGMVLEPTTIPDRPKDADVPPMTTGVDAAEIVPLPITTPEAPEEGACTVCPPTVTCGNAVGVFGCTGIIVWPP